MFGLEAIFGNRQPQQVAAPAPAPAAPTNNPAQNPAPAAPASSAVTAPNGAVPADGNKPGDQSPGDKFATLWEPVKTEEPKPGEQSQGLTPEKMLEAASKVDFTKNLNPEIVQKLQAGGPEAVQATLALMNQTSQQVYGQGLVVTQKLIERAVEQAQERFVAQLPNLVKSQTAQEALAAANPAFTNPAVAPVVDAVKSQLQLKFPKASSQEIAQMAQDYFKEAAGVFAGKPATQQTQTTAAGEDWDAWISTPIGGKSA